MDRQAAFFILKDIERNGAYSNLAVNKFFSVNKVDSPAFVRELVYGVLRHQLLLDYNINRYVKKLKNSDRILLRMGFYQLCFMNSVSDYAAVNETVALSKNRSFINAVLRSFIRGGKELKDDGSFSVRYSCSSDIVKLFEEAYGTQTTEEILKNSLAVPKLCERINLNGTISIQGKSSRLAVETLSPKPGERVIDICAAPGGKSIYACQLMNNTGEILAFDLYEHRVRLINKEAQRTGCEIITASAADGTVYNPLLESYADAVICDVPCSGLGVIAKKPELKIKGLSPDMPQLYLLQGALLENASRYVKPKGRLLYSTCTLNPLENEDRIKNFTVNHINFELISEKQLFPDGELDGFYIALLKRKE